MTTQEPDVVPIIESRSIYGSDHQVLADTVAEFLVAQIESERERVIQGYSVFVRGAVSWVYRRVAAIIHARAADALARVFDRVGPMTLDQIFSLIANSKTTVQGQSHGDASVDLSGSRESHYQPGR